MLLESTVSFICAAILVFNLKIFEGTMKKLTLRQQQVLTIIRETIKNTGFPPTRAELSRTLGFRSINAAEEHLQALARKGAIEIVPGLARGIRLTNDKGELLSDGLTMSRNVPVIDGTAVGTPVFSPRFIVAERFLDAQLFAGRPDYLLKVRGPLMSDMGMREGDLAAVRNARKIRSDQVVVVRINGEVAVRRYQRSGRNVEFHSENPNVDPVILKQGSPEYLIEGRVVGVVREF